MPADSHETTDADVSTLDLTVDETTAGQESIPAEDTDLIRQRPYNPRRIEDQARKRIAYTLIALLFVICIATILGVMADWLTKDEAVALLQLILSPVVALVSAATGFYYGTKSETGTDS